MHILIVYCHPSSNSFTYKVKEEFIKGITAAGHTYTMSDLYEMKFDSIFSEKEYLREAFYNEATEVPEDVLAEQEKIMKADMIAFIYPNFWTDAPAMLTGWFQRVWTYGFAYGNSPKMKVLDKALFLVTMGGSLKDEVRQKQVEAMKTVMIGDRINQRAKTAEMIIFDEMTRGYGNDGHREENEKVFLEKAYGVGYSLQDENIDDITSISR